MPHRKPRRCCSRRRVLVHFPPPPPCFLILRMDAQLSLARKNEKPASGPDAEVTPAATGGTPTTALARLPANQARSRSRLDARSAAREDTVDLKRSSWFGEMRDNELPGSSVLRHRVREGAQPNSVWEGVLVCVHMLPTVCDAFRGGCSRFSFICFSKSF